MCVNYDRNGALRFGQSLKIGTKYVHFTRRLACLVGWAYCEVRGGTSGLGKKGRQVAGVARKLAVERKPPTTSGQTAIRRLKQGLPPRSGLSFAD